MTRRITTKDLEIKVCRLAHLLRVKVWGIPPEIRDGWELEDSKMKGLSLGIENLFGSVWAVVVHQNSGIREILVRGSKRECLVGVDALEIGIMLGAIFARTERKDFPAYEAAWAKELAEGSR